MCSEEMLKIPSSTSISSPINAISDENGLHCNHFTTQWANTGHYYLMKMVYIAIILLHNGPILDFFSHIWPK